MTLLQLDPHIPVWIEDMGTGQAIGWLDYSSEHDLMWIIALDNTGEIWTVKNPRVRLQKNITVGRTL